MKKKLLVTGTNTALVKDFIKHANSYFNCISTTDCWIDIQKHYEFFEPEGLLIFPDNADDETIELINTLKSHRCYNGTPIFLCAQVDVCADIQRSNPRLVNLMLKRPVSADNLSLRINKYFDEEEARCIQADDANKFVLYENHELTKQADEEPSRKHLLIVDDDRSVLKMLKAAMEEEYEITTIINGLLTEKVLQTQKIDLVILDYRMPVETGAEVMKRIRKNSDYDDIPVCFLTGVSDRTEIMEILSLKPDAYLLKPVNIEMLRATVSNLLM